METSERGEGLAGLKEVGWFQWGCTAVAFAYLDSGASEGTSARLSLDPHTPCPHSGVPGYHTCGGATERRSHKWPSSLTIQTTQSIHHELENDAMRAQHRE